MSIPEDQEPIEKTCYAPDGRLIVYDLEITNVGAQRVHCSILALFVDEVLYPLSCGWLEPRETYNTLTDFPIYNSQDADLVMIGRDGPSLFKKQGAKSFKNIEDVSWHEVRCD